MLDFAVKMTKTPYKHTREDVETLRAAGFDDTGVLQITLIAAYFNYINRVADALGVGKPEEPKPLRLLWVENHAGFVRTAGRQFLAAYEVTAVSSLADAKVALAARTFDAVLLDYDLNDGKGVELFDVIRQLPKPPAVIATSARDVGNEALLAAGATAACAKTKFATIESVLASCVKRT